MVDFRERKRRLAVFIAKRVLGYKTGQSLPKWFMYTFFPLYSLYLSNAKVQWIMETDELLIEGVIINTGFFYHLKKVAENNLNPNRRVTYEISVKVEKKPEDWVYEKWIKDCKDFWRAELYVTAFDSKAMELKKNLIKRLEEEIAKGGKWHG